MQVDCEGCGAVLRLKEEFIGRRIKCPKCGTSQMVPEPEPERSPYDDDPLFSINAGPSPPPVHQSLRPTIEQPPQPAYYSSSMAPQPSMLNPSHPAANPLQPIHTPTTYYPDGAAPANFGTSNHVPASAGYAPPSYSTYGSVPSTHGGFPITSPPVVHSSSVAGAEDQGHMAGGPRGAYPSATSPTSYMEPSSPPTKPWSISPGKIALGLLMMLGAVVWFVLGLAADRIFYYPPILFIIGIASVVKGFLGQDE